MPMTAHRQSGSTRWFAAVVDAAPVDAPEYRCKLVGASGQARALYLAGQIDMALPSSAQWPGGGVVFDGALFNGRDLQDQLGDVGLTKEDGFVRIKAEGQVVQGDILNVLPENLRIADGR